MRISSPSQRMFGSTKVVCCVRHPSAGTQGGRCSVPSVPSPHRKADRRPESDVNPYFFLFCVSVRVLFFVFLAVDVFFFLSCLRVLLVVRIACRLITAAF
jgi:hypothetical protein